jgi:hypothetical protein
MTNGEWERLLNAIDDGIVRCGGGDDEKERIIMEIRSSIRSFPVWKCANCGRLVTCIEGEMIWLRKDQN